MSSNNFLTVVNGIKQLVTAITSSTGVNDANKIVMTDSGGKLNSSLIPIVNSGVAGNVTSVQYDAQNRISSYIVNGVSFNITYNTLTTIIVGGGFTRTITYNENGRLISDITA